MSQALRLYFLTVTKIYSQNLEIKASKGFQRLGSPKVIKEGYTVDIPADVRTSRTATEALLIVRRAMVKIQRPDKLNGQDYPPSSTPSSLGGVKGKGEGGKGLNPLPFSLSPFPSPHKRIFGLADH
ncbi:hypothetical protein I8751_14170 [Nostocaceae cyanobacterium CENA357]|uniref:Uncharacterized protein n=1 Tax=Atlanticothrix silvestris CENA357 TaxID=1725252 RepID=A0A8J7L361_9CYAN|nr:hypothetical protein [Atlanticothrix silvestris]MBH8553496.1 hypothetical protein [Atlanticothrix silvestris CENA357]